MLVYWVLFALISFFAVYVNENTSTDKTFKFFRVPQINWHYLSIFVFLILFVFVGFRYNVGGDFGQYRLIYTQYANDTFIQSLLPKSLSSVDPGWGAINWLVHRFDPFEGIYWNDVYRIGGYIYVNALAGIIFTYFLLKFIFQMPRPMLALAIAFPYVIIVVGMGYVRQGVAFSIIAYAILLLGQRKFLYFAFLIILASLFHKSAAIFLPFLFIVATKNKFLIFLASLLLFGIIYFALIASHLESMVANYIDYELNSRGALIRLIMLIPPAFIFLKFKDRFSFSSTENQIFSILSYASFLFLFLALTVFASNTTAIDRLGLYFISLQIIIFSHFPSIFQPRNQIFVIILILLYYALTMFVWLSFATNAGSWLPYRNVLFLESSNYLWKFF